MKKAVPIVLVVIVLIVSILLFTNKKPASKNNTMSMSSASSSNSNSSNTDKVSITNFSFSPSAITVKKGTTVTWTNHDSVAHTVVETDGKTGPSSQNINDGQSFSFTYNEVGAFAYHCSVHPEMVGTVTVTN